MWKKRIGPGKINLPDSLQMNIYFGAIAKFKPKSTEVSGRLLFVSLFKQRFAKGSTVIPSNQLIHTLNSKGFVNHMPARCRALLSLTLKVVCHVAFFHLLNGADVRGAEVEE